MATQTYANHRFQARLWITAFLLALVAYVLLAMTTWRALTLQTAGLLILSVAVMVGLVVSRRFTLRLQNRIIRLEMQLRLDRLGRGADLDRLSPAQVIALRFASDAELPALIDRAIAEGLSNDQIKRAVVEWQPDLRRT